MTDYLDSKLKFHIIASIIDGPTGGGNQFLKNLRNYFIENEMYSEHLNANVIIYNGHQFINDVQNCKSQSQDVIFIHRLDGLQKLYNHPGDVRQDQAIDATKYADGIVFQAKWAKENFEKYGFKPDKPNVIIPNSVDEKLFKPSDNKLRQAKIKILCTSWSSNENKGFKWYEFLDSNLDFDRYDFHFIGNKPNWFKTKNVICHSPMTTKEISEKMRDFDIFLTATKHECCSNSLLEALASGLPVIALDSGGNSELVKDGGELFQDEKTLLEKIDLVSNNIEHYCKNIYILSMNDIGKMYVDFAKSLKVNI